ncbi:hypothetical protein SNEBB_004343 [Seison nebaliae]|nr:hypothetical protein SNEBB_004343 [Seison nebaliae]
MVHYKLLYFPLYGKGEIIRLLFAAANQEYENFIIKMEDWPTYKPKMPNGMLPVLEVNGKQMTENRILDIYVDAMVGFNKSGAPMAFLQHGMNAAETKAALNKYFEETVKKFFPIFRKVLESNMTNSGYFVKDTLTLADLQMFVYLDVTSQFFPDFFATYPIFQKFLEKIRNDSSLKKYLADRPQAPF